MHQLLTMRIIFAILAAVIFCHLSAFGQMDRFILLEKPGKQKSRIRYYIGDEIQWRFKEDKTTYTAVVASINDSTFVTSEALIVPYQEIEMIVMPANGSVRSIGTMAFYAIPPIIVFDAANNLFNTGNTPVVSSEALAISGIFASISALSYLIPKTKKKNLEKKWRILPIIH